MIFCVFCICVWLCSISSENVPVTCQSSLHTIHSALRSLFTVSHLYHYCTFEGEGNKALDTEEHNHLPFSFSLNVLTLREEVSSAPFCVNPKLSSAFLKNLGLVTFYCGLLPGKMVSAWYGDMGRCPSSFLGAVESLSEMSSLPPGRPHGAFSSSTRGNELVVADAWDGQTPSCRSEWECERKPWGPGPTLTETGF